MAEELIKKKLEKRCKFVKKENDELLIRNCYRACQKRLVLIAEKLSMIISNLARKMLTQTS